MEDEGSSALERPLFGLSFLSEEEEEHRRAKKCWQ